MPEHDITPLHAAHVLCCMAAVVCGMTGAIGMVFWPSLSAGLLLAVAGAAAGGASLASAGTRRGRS